MILGLGFSWFCYGVGSSPQNERKSMDVQEMGALPRPQKKESSAFSIELNFMFVCGLTHDFFEMEILYVDAIHETLCTLAVSYAHHRQTFTKQCVC